MDPLYCTVHSTVEETCCTLKNPLSPRTHHFAKKLTSAIRTNGRIGTCSYTLIFDISLFRPLTSNDQARRGESRSSRSHFSSVPVQLFWQPHFSSVPVQLFSSVPASPKTSSVECRETASDKLNELRIILLGSFDSSDAQNEVCVADGWDPRVAADPISVQFQFSCFADPISVQFQFSCFPQSQRRPKHQA